MNRSKLENIGIVLARSNLINNNYQEKIRGFAYIYTIKYIWKFT